MDDDERLSRNVYVVSAVSFFQDTASEILYPILPFFVVGVLGAPPAVLGAIEGLADGIASAMKALSGRLADLRHRRPIGPRRGFPSQRINPWPLSLPLCPHLA